MRGEEVLPRVLVLNDTGLVGGAELVLLDVGGRLRRASEVVLLSDGPLAERSRAVDARAEVVPAEPPLPKVCQDGRCLVGARATA